MSRRPAPSRLQRFVVEALEPRLLYSADVGPSLLGAVMPPVAEQRLLESEPLTQAHEVVFVDAATPDADRLISDIASQPGRTIDVVRIGADEDGLARIGAELAARQDVSAVHIISHGSDGAVYLGSSVLDLQSLHERSGELAAWGGSLTPDADLLIYGCDVAQTATGQALVEQLAAVTGADVAASTNLTGSAALGGDFNLEFRSGAVETQAVLNQASTLDWQGLLDVTADTSSSAATNMATSSLTWSHTVSASGSDAFLLVSVGTVEGATSVASVTYGGTALTRIGDITDATGKVSVELWGLKAPAAGTADVVVNLAGAAAMSAGATTFFGVDQTTPYSTTAFAQGGGGAASVTLASAPGELVVDSVVSHAISTFSTGANQTPLWSELTGNTPKDPWQASSSEAGAASVTMDWTKTGTGAGQWASGALSLRPAGPNSAPVLTGANDLGTILEDSTANGGTQVADLIAGHVSDANAGALTGIAVTGVDNSNGVWQYSIDGGSTWNAFGSPTAATARLLSADASTFVRFVPNANFNGTVTNGLTFRAWDRTSGVSGGTADTTSASQNVSDTFTAATYSNNDGTASWSTSWVDADGNPAAGNIRVTGGELVLSTFIGTESVYREVDLSGASGASLSFSYDNQLGLLGSVSLQASNDGGATYSTLATFSSGTNTGSGTYTADLGAYLASDTRVRFQMSGTLLGGSFHVDNVEVAYATPLSGGTTAFSASTASTSIFVTAVNDAPAGASNTVTTLEDTAYVFGAADFGFSDSDGNAFAGVKIAALPGAGTLTDNGVAVSAGQIVSAADIAAGHLSFIAAPNANGVGYASFSFQVQDDGGTAAGGVNLDPVARTMTVNVTPVNDAPIAKNVSVTALEDTAYVFATTDFGFSDPDGNSLLAVRIASLPTAGVLTDNGVAVSLGQSVSAADIAAGLLRFTPAPDANGAGYAAFKFQVRDNGGTANGGVDFDPAVRTMTVDVTPVNDAPAGADNTVTTLEDTAYVFTAADFGFTDIDGGVLTSVDIASLPVSGALTDNGVAVTSGQSVSAADIAAGLLRFTPASNANGAGYASFTFQVQDDGGMANGGVALDPIARTMTVNVTSVNDAPAAANHTVTTAEDTAYAFAAGDFGFSDTDGNAFAAVKIAALPASGTLTNNGAVVTAGQSVSAADIAAGLLRFTPAAGASGAAYASFSFQVQDDGGTAAGGVDLDPVARTMTVNVTAVNDAPAGANNTVTVLEDSAYVFAAADFGFTDADGNALAGVKIAALPNAGALTNNGVAVSAGQVVSAADIVAGLLRFTPTANANGAGYASFSFQVQDDGGTANGGADLDPIARTMSVNVAAVNDAPSGASNTMTVIEDGAHVFTATDFGFSDADGNAFTAVRIAAVPASGALTDNGVAVSAGQLISAADIAAGLLRFTPEPNANGAGYASFSFQVQDDGGTANGGTDLDPIARTMTLNVTAVNDAPTGTNNAVVMQQDGTYAFSAADFGFSDSDGNAFAGVVISTVPPGGLITDNGAPVAAGQTVSAGDIAAGMVRYTPILGASGMPYASFTFRVQDSGGTANGGTDTDTVARTMTINVVSAGSVGPLVGPVAVPAPPAKVQSQPPTPVAPAATNANTPALTEQTAPAAASARLLLASNDVVGTRIDADEGFRFQTVSAQPLGSVFATAQRLTNFTPAAAPAVGSPGSVAASDEKQFEFQLFGSLPVSDRAGGSGSRAAGLAGDLDRMRDDLGEQADLHHWVSGSIAVGSFGLTVGYVLWLLRGGALLASLLSSLPAWRLIDPLPVLSRVDDEDDAEEDQDAFVSFEDANLPFPVTPEKA